MTNSVRLFLGLLLAGLADAASPWSLRLVHVNDMHAHLEATEATLGQDTLARVPLGGAASLATAFAQLRREKVPTLFLHAGDQFSGTPWFSRYQGLADAAVLDRLGFDAFVPGNHEFDKGPEVLGRFLDSLHVPALAANLDARSEPALQGKLRKGMVLEVAGHRVGIAGVAHPDTRNLSSPGPALRFQAASVVRATVDSLRKTGAEIVVLLSHAGFEEDTVLARSSGADAVVGGHTHLRMGDFRREGLAGGRAYPYPVKLASGVVVPVVQAWEHGKEIGVLELDIESGKIVAMRGKPFLPVGDSLQWLLPGLADTTGLRLRRTLESRGAVRILAADPGMQTLLKGLSGPLDSLRRAAVGHLPEPLGHRKGRLLQVCAASLKEAGETMGAQVGLVNAGGVREDLDSGTVTREDVQRVLPFGNEVVVLTLTGRELSQAVKALRAQRGHVLGLDGAQILTDSLDRFAGVQLAGASLAMRDSDTVRVATNSYLAGGGSGCRMLKRATGTRRGLGTTDAQALETWIARHHPRQAQSARPALQRAE